MVVDCETDISSLRENCDLRNKGLSVTFLCTRRLVTLVAPGVSQVGLQRILPCIERGLGLYITLS